ncbi:streptococcal hemagglutinin [Drosophila kikkawai]|uniref:Serine-rich adhesin for platelets n=1 Tax=Drosophila kikkawai TaxID=30033 RepID=A0A6P4I8C0_DROKI|nr:serine-rich adhesin for platelets isoform X1 [Drosophila kikkawai]XP_017020138.1 serine-rich adhesin for platelets isoform X1 [Drosophila kikkawai]
MSSSICAHFTQNAWKKDLCSNCFKSKDEHKAAAAAAASKSGGSSHKAESQVKTDYPNKHKTPAKSIIKKAFGVRLTSSSSGSGSSSSSSKSGSSKTGKVCFPKQLHEIIGYGGEWSDDDDDDDDHDFMNLGNEHDDMAITETDDEETVELKRITRANTDFNMNNGNLLGDAEDNIKKSFAALKLGAPQVDKEGKKQTLTINVMPFGEPLGKSAASTAAKSTSATAVTSSAGATPAKAKLATVTTTAIKSSSSTTTTSTGTASVTKKVTTTLTPTLTMTKSSKTTVAASTVATTTSSRDGKDSPPIERAMEKSLLDEISETLEQNHKQSETGTTSGASASGSGGVSSHVTGTSNKIKFELSALSDAPKPFLDLKKPIARNAPITRDQTKPKVNVCHKYSDTDSNCSDTENGVSAYYDVVETQLSYENLPDGKYSEQVGVATAAQTDASGNSHYSSSQYITDMLLSSKTRAASYNLHEGNFMTSKITSDGLIVTKCSSDDALDSTGSSFDGSSDEENAYNMIRSESDSGIGISLGSEYKNLGAAKGAANQQLLVEKKLSASTNNSDYEDIQVGDQAGAKPAVKSRELHGEPDGSADPDNSLELKQQQKEQPEQQVLPALPKSPPPPMKIDARPSFLHGLKKPELPVKPLVTNSSNSSSVSGTNSSNHSPLKSFLGKRQPSCAEQQFISQLQSAISKSSESLLLAKESLAADEAKLKKGKAPNPPPEPKLSAPPTPERDYSLVVEFEQATKAAAKPAEKTTSPGSSDSPSGDKSAPVGAAPGAVSGSATVTGSPSANNSSLYTRKAALPAAGAAPVIREKDKRERAVINPKFRSLNTFVMQRANAAKQLQLQSASSVLSLKQPMTPEPTPRNQRHLSMSEECLAAAGLDKKSSSPSASPPQKQKSKFSIKKFLRMGSNSGSGAKSGESLNKKESSIYTEICTGTEEGSASGKPRLVIIHPIDINPTAVEVVKDITKTSDSVSAQTVAVVTAKPPAPPLRSSASEGQRAHEANKPARPPPPKSAELRRKQKTELTATLSASSVESTVLASGNGSGSVKLKADNVYANLGEIRSSIAPRKPERTASMREREAQLELVRKRGVLTDTISICSSNGENVATDQGKELSKPTATGSGLQPEASGKSASSANSRTSTFERTMPQKKSEPKMSISSKLEIFEQRSNSGDATDTAQRSSLKDSVRKINSTIDSYLKDKRDYENMYEFVKMGSPPPTTANGPATPTSASTSTPPPPPTRSNLDLASVAGQRLTQATRRNINNNNIYSDTASIASYTRSEYGPVRNYGLNNSLANIPRIISASYAGSEVGEFDIYAPYSYYGSEAGGDVATDINDSVWGMPQGNKNRSKATNRLRMRKGRSVVHKTIEDNYTAVVVANHEALAQVLDQLQQTPVVPTALRPLANAINLRYEDFSILEGAQAFVVGKKAFHAALWSSSPVTLALSADCNQLGGVGGELSQLTGGVSDVLNPVTEFCDLVPSYQLPLMPSTEVTLLQATISVLPRLQLETLQSIGAILKGKSQVLDKSNFNFRGSIPNLSGLKDGNGSSAGNLRNVVSVQNLSTLNEESPSITGSGEDGCSNANAMPAFDDVMTREVAFIMLQLVNGMKNLQAKAIEETPLSLSNVVLSKDMDNKDAQARLCVLQGNNNDDDEPMGTLCKCAHSALTDMLPATKITPVLADILQQERAESLSKAKAVLEFVLWGPSDVALTGSVKERELALQRWLDLERATVLHGLVRTRVELTVYDECHLMFLVRSTAKMMNDAAKIVCSYQQQAAASGPASQD